MFSWHCSPMASSLHNFKEMKEMKEIFCLNWFANLSLVQRFAVIAAITAFCCVLFSAMAANLFVFVASCIAFYVACKWVGKLETDIEE